MIIYKVTNKVNGKVYIGQTCRELETRRQDHYYANDSHHFHRALSKYDKSDFVWETLCECSSIEELHEKECYYIELYDTYKNGYNMTFGGQGRRSPFPEEGKRKLSEQFSGRKLPKEWCENISKALKGRVFTEEWKQKIRDNHNGGVKEHTEETKQKISESMSGENNPMYGRNHTEETRQIIREKMSGSNSPLSQKYIITTPEGEEIEIDGLREFCREHGLTRELMGAVSRGLQTHHKGYKCRKLT